MVPILIATVLGGVGTAVFLWHIGIVVALIGAPFGASLCALLVGVARAYFGSADLGRDAKPASSTRAHWGTASIGGSTLYPGLSPATRIILGNEPRLHI